MQRISHVDNELHKKLKNLEQDWDFIKRSTLRPRRRRCRRRCCSDDEKSTITTSVEILHQLLDYSSPRMLISSLQQCKLHSPCLEEEEEWKVMSNDLAVSEILRERRAAIVSGKLKGRRLLEDLESAASSSHQKVMIKGNETNIIEEEGYQNIGSGCSSSVVIQGNDEVRSYLYSTTSYSSSDNDGVDDDLNGFYGYCYSSSSSCSHSFVEKKGIDKGGYGLVEEEEGYHDFGIAIVGVSGWSDGGKWMVVMGWFAIFLMAFALGIITWKSFDEYGDEYEEILFPFPT